MNSNIIETYRQHPLRKKTILSRIADDRGSTSGITELDLACDDNTEITDQNHVGGIGFVEQMALHAGVTSSSRILDLGCGLGGSARYLAQRFGCHVHGIDLSKDRCEEARELTELVGLQELVTFECGDMMTIQVPSERHDIIWGQSAWVHIDDKPTFIRRWSSALASGGKLAMEEACIKTPPESLLQKDLISRLEHIWNSHLVDRRVWMDILCANRFSVQIMEDLSSALTVYYSKQIGIAALGGKVTAIEAEQKGWDYSVQLSSVGIVGYFRLVAEKR